MYFWSLTLTRFVRFPANLDSDPEPDALARFRVSVPSFALPNWPAFEAFCSGFFNPNGHASALKLEYKNGFSPTTPCAMHGLIDN